MLTAKEDAKTSGKKRLTYSDVNDALYELFQFTQLPAQFPTELPWPEWSDADLNSETWGADGGKAKSAVSTSKIRGKSEMEMIVSRYWDPSPGLLPPDLEKHVDSWKRPEEVFPPESLVMYDPGNADVSLKIPSEIASKCELFEIISDVLCLLRFYSVMEVIPTEYETPHYASNTKSQPWQPWHHIYGNCKAGRDQIHRPVVYPYGKYILRLFYMGAWRKFIVDDLIPCDSRGKSLLPVTPVTGEIWPILLVKGILKISSLTQTSRFADMDLPVWTLFTGWISVPICLLNKSTEQIWRWIHSISPHFVLRDDHEESVKMRREPSIPAKGGTKKTEAESQLPAHEEGRPVLIVGELSNFPEEYANFGDACRVVILMTRDIPLTRTKAKKPIERWKRIRWARWASERGMWRNSELLPPYRFLHQINFKDGLNELLAVDETLEDRMLLSEEVTEKPEQPAQGEMPAANGPMQWIGFFKFATHLSSLLFLIKPSAFLSKYRLTYLTVGPQYRNRSSTADTEFPHHIMMPNIKTCGNEPSILHCESDTGIFITFSLWVCPHSPVDSRFYLAPDQPEFLKVYHAALIVETHDWRTSKQNEIVALIRTVGNSCSSVFLNPGRHALKVWLDADSPFVIDVHSNAEMTFGKGSKIRFLMSTETKLVTSYINQISAAFLDLAQKFGKPDFRKSLLVFYARIKPGNTTEPQYERKVHDFIETFVACIVKVLRSLVASDEELKALARVLRVLFVSPNLWGPPARLKRRISGAANRSGDEKEASIGKEAAEDSVFDLSLTELTPDQVEKVIAVQKTYRGYRVRSLLRDQSPNSREFKALTDRLKNICDSMFAANKRDVEVTRLIREIIAARRDLLTMFSFHRDISNVTITEEYTGKIVGVEPKTWVPMIRFTFSCHSPDPLPCAFYLSCNLEQYLVTVTDNDTYEEVFRLVNATCPHYYPRNGKGYTLLACGWNESEAKTVNWKLEMIKMKYFSEIHPCNTAFASDTGSSCLPYQPQSLFVQELRNFYVPNKRNKICQCLIKIRRNILLTVRLTMSHENARFHVRIYLRSGGHDDSVYAEGGIRTNTVIEAEAKSSVIVLPSVLLDYHPRTGDFAKSDHSNRTVYVMEAHVVNHTWPLTKHEWGVVEPMRVNGETWHESRSTASINQLKKAPSESRRKYLRSSKSLTATEKLMEDPFWYLQVVTDSVPDPSNVMEVVEDRSHQEMIKFMKESWEENDPGRRMKGRATQREFLKLVHDRALESTKLHSMSLHAKSSEFFGLMKNFEESSASASEESFEALLHEMKSFSYLLQDKTTERYHVSPRILPWVPLEELVAKYSRGKEETDSSSSTDHSKHMPGENCEVDESAVYGATWARLDRKELLKAMSSHRKVLERHVARENQLSRKLMDQAYEERARAVEKMKALREKAADPKSRG